jgi:hypothetical protein
LDKQGHLNYNAYHCFRFASHTALQLLHPLLHSYTLFSPFWQYFHLTASSCKGRTVITRPDQLPLDTEYVDMLLEVCRGIRQLIQQFNDLDVNTATRTALSRLRLPLVRWERKIPELNTRTIPPSPNEHF